MAGRYSDNFKTEAIALADKLGVAETASKLGVHIKTLYGWCRDARAASKKTVARAPVAAKKVTLPKTAESPALPAQPESPDSSLSRAFTIVANLKSIEEALLELGRKVDFGTATENDVKLFVEAAGKPFDFLRSYVR